MTRHRKFGIYSEVGRLLYILANHDDGVNAWLDRSSKVCHFRNVKNTRN